jgi:hypothetical protein
LTSKITRVTSMIMCEVIPAVCICGGEQFDYDTDAVGTTASCKRCRRLYMGFETHPELVRQP